MTRLMRDWRALEPDQRLAAGAALALFVTMLLPWYQQNAVVNAPRTAPLQSRNLNAFGAFSFVEAAVLLVAVAVIYLLYARAEGHEFHLPGSDGAVVMAAGLWTALLLVIRLFDKPGISSHGVAANVGVQWGIFFALGAAGLLAYTGSRMRAGRRLEPPLARSAREGYAGRSHPRPPPAPPSSAMREDDRPAANTATARGQRPAGPPAPRGISRPAKSSPPASRAARRPVPASPTTEQLSFEDPPTEPEKQRSA
ncbi:MAG TPA: hypothetical protein VNY27_05985 [Solirubrobacteraceae bacterium]|jgi:hypothetical protein|nr:hypothetical protein [Solirubrobacteraceae bacterium]